MVAELLWCCGHCCCGCLAWGEFVREARGDVEYGCVERGVSEGAVDGCEVDVTCVFDGVVAERRVLFECQGLVCVDVVFDAELWGFVDGDDELAAGAACGEVGVVPLAVDEDDFFAGVGFVGDVERDVGFAVAAAGDVWTVNRVFVWVDTGWWCDEDHWVSLFGEACVVEV